MDQRYRALHQEILRLRYAPHRMKGAASRQTARHAGPGWWRGRCYHATKLSLPPELVRNQKQKTGYIEQQNMATQHSKPQQYGLHQHPIEASRERSPAVVGPRYRSTLPCPSPPDHSTPLRFAQDDTPHASNGATHRAGVLVNAPVILSGAGAQRRWSRRIS
ncbi:hypothetical protein CYPRO_1328 [Cyclonatronum proteinivorum]|uniref:Uncharacterized protein n=1 Tax=Cyclonatronum proteinivorum TaxID=1457365 RepID=A0A345UJD3_9BACT|nr:hypothetical protein CYPRO_1328 [Cyclonatronum proteinivorum]